jgi:hypothetical protein
MDLPADGALMTGRPCASSCARLHRADHVKSRAILAVADLCTTVGATVCDTAYCSRPAAFRASSTLRYSRPRTTFPSRTGGRAPAPGGSHRPFCSLGLTRPTVLVYGRAVNSSRCRSRGSEDQGGIRPCYPARKASVPVAVAPGDPR